MIKDTFLLQCISSTPFLRKSLCTSKVAIDWTLAIDHLSILLRYWTKDVELNVRRIVQVLTQADWKTLWKYFEQRQFPFLMFQKTVSSNDFSTALRAAELVVYFQFYPLFVFLRNSHLASTSPNSSKQSINLTVRYSYISPEKPSKIFFQEFIPINKNHN